MPRPVQIRASYRDDAAFLLRLENAVGKDDRQSEGWREETCAMIRSLSTRLLQAEGQRLTNGLPGGPSHTDARSSKKARERRS